MTTSTKSRRNVRWDDKSVEVLKDEYVKFDVTSDDLAADKNKAAEFTRRFAQRSGMSTSAEVVIRKLINLRKKSKLPTIRH